MLNSYIVNLIPVHSRISLVIASASSSRVYIVLLQLSSLFLCNADRVTILVYDSNKGSEVICPTIAVGFFPIMQLILKNLFFFIIVEKLAID